MNQDYNGQDYNGSVYGTGIYDQSSYSTSCTDINNCVTTVPGAPNTGLMQQPAFLVPAILVLAVLIVAAEFFIRRALAKRRRATNAAKAPTEPTPPQQ